MAHPGIHFSLSQFVSTESDAPIYSPEMHNLTSEVAHQGILRTNLASTSEPDVHNVSNPNGMHEHHSTNNLTASGDGASGGNPSGNYRRNLTNNLLHDINNMQVGNRGLNNTYTINNSNGPDHCKRSTVSHFEQLGTSYST